MRNDDATSIAAAEMATDKRFLSFCCTRSNGRGALEEIGRELNDLVDAEDAVCRLSGAGLVHRLDGFVFPTRAAIHAVDLDLAGE
jgi:hypothetical protein